MNLATLIALSKAPIDMNDPDVIARFAKARKRMAEFDKRIEEETRRRIPTQEQLNKVVNWGTLYG
ncbi:hypothetical protein D3C87_1372020 [compost metagenome]